MRIRTNSSGPGGLIRRALRIGALGGLAATLFLGQGVIDAQAHGRFAHFGGGWHGARASSGFGPRNGGLNPGPRPGEWQRRARANQRFARRQMRPARRNGLNRPRRGQYNNARSGQMQGMRQPNTAAGARPAYTPQENANPNAPGMRAREGGFTNSRPGQEHLPQWWQAHRNLSPQQQAEAMRREPGFRSLPRAQQRRLLNSLRNFDSRPPQVQQRMLSRVEMFERLSPERQQEVRGASAAFNRMPPQRKQEMIRAFQQLRQMPPAERQQMLRSSYGQQFTPRERTILGNLLSIEPYAPSSGEPYFGRPH